MNCPMCSQKMRVNDYKDQVCKCQGKLLDLPALLKLKSFQSVPYSEIAKSIQDKYQIKLEIKESTITLKISEERKAEMMADFLYREALSLGL